MDEKQYILITGASRGLGFALAEKLAPQNIQLILLAKQAASLTTSADKLQARHDPYLLVFDLASTDIKQYQQLSNTLEDAIPRLDTLIHHAGILGKVTPIEHYDLTSWHQIMQINLHSSFLLTNCLLSLLKQSTNPSICFTISKKATQAKAFWSAYNISQAGRLALMQSLHEELGKIISINAIDPGDMNTTFRRMAYPYEKMTSLSLMSDTAEQYLSHLQQTKSGQWSHLDKPN